MRKTGAPILTLALALLMVLVFTAGCEEDKPARPSRSTGVSADTGHDSDVPVKDGPEPGGDASVSSSAKKTSGDKIRLAFIPKSLHIPVFDYARIGAERKAEEYGNVEILWDAPRKNDHVKQREILEKFIEDGVDGIAISCLNAADITPAIDRAVEAGIPVVTWDSDAPDSKRLAFYGVNDFEAGVIMGKEIVKLLGPEGGQVAVLTTLGADNLNKRLEGAMSVLRQHSGIKVVETFDVEDQLVVATRVVESAEKTYPDLRAWLSVGGWPGFSEDILDPVDTDQTYVITFDTIPPAPDIIAKGKIELAVGQKYFGWGAEPTRILYDAIVYDKKPENKFVDSGVDIVTPENVGEYMKKWRKMESENVSGG